MVAIHPPTCCTTLGDFTGNSHRGRVLAVAALLVITMGAEQGDQQPGNRNALRVIALFNGKDLEGWRQTKFGGEGEVVVEDGAIVMDIGNSMTGITTTRGNLPTMDYELSYEARRLAGSDFFAAATVPVGKSHVTFVNGGWGSSVTGISSLDDLDASENETATSQVYRDQTWYRFRVRVTNRKIQCLIDDRLVVDVSYEDRRLGTRVEVELNKPLGFAAWETRGAIRSIRMRRLAAEEIAAINKSGDPP